MEEEIHVKPLTSCEAAPCPIRFHDQDAPELGDDAILQQLYCRLFTASSISHSTALNILAVYMKGQKVLHINAKTHHESKLNCLMLPAIINSAACTVLSVVLKEYEYGATILSSLTAFNSCVLALISYLKLDAKAEAHKASAYQYDKLQSLCEFHAGKFLFFAQDKGTERFYRIMTEIETKVKEIKDANQFVFPESVRQRYPVIYTTNVFAVIRRLQNVESTLCNEYVGLVRTGASPEVVQAHVNKIIKHKSEYLQVDTAFNDEMQAWPTCCGMEYEPFQRDPVDV